MIQAEDYSTSTDYDEDKSILKVELVTANKDDKPKVTFSVKENLVY